MNKNLKIVAILLCATLCLAQSTTYIKIGGSQALTGTQGTTGTKVFACTGTFTSGGLVSSDANGNCVDSGVSMASPGAIGGGTPAAGTFTSETAATHNTTTNCSANGSAANPSIVNCGTASAGHFSCDVAASAGTCHVNTTAVTVNSEIFVNDSDTFTTGAGLGVTCNSAPSTVPATLLAVQTGASGFDINVGTIAGTPSCYSFLIVN